MTLKANELRIGNYLNGKQGHVTVTEIRKNNIVKIQDNTSSFYVGTCLKPIPLTEEWLLKFDMEYADEFSNQRKLYVKKHEYDISQITYSEKEGLMRLSNGEQKGTMLIPHIKYVHQLQNLYFALTGEELTLKNNSNN